MMDGSTPGKVSAASSEAVSPVSVRSFSAEAPLRVSTSPLHVHTLPASTRAKVVLVGPTDDALPVEYEGSFICVAEPGVPTAVSVAEPATTAAAEHVRAFTRTHATAGDAHGVPNVLEGIVKLASMVSDGPELLRHLQRAWHVQYLRSYDHASALPVRFPAATHARVGRAVLHGSISARGSGAASSAANSLLPEVLWHGTSGEALVAEGTGTLRDALTGACVYSGAWRLGLRHGSGKALVYERRSVGGDELVDPCAAVPAVLVGEYDGEWALGLRHGRGCLTQDSGDKYDGQWSLDLEHGQGTLHLAGGGVFKGNWFRGRKHGCGVFTWPVANRAEWREYEHGKLLAVRAIEVIGRPASQLHLNGGVAAPLQHFASSQSLHHSSIGTGDEVMGHEAHMLGLPIDSPALGPHVDLTAGAVPPTSVLAAVHHVPVARPNAGVLRFLKHASVNDVPGGRASSGEVVTVDVKDPIEMCLTRMTENSVLSVPVFDASKEKFVAILHILDIFAFMLDLVSKKKASFSPSGASLRETLAHQRRFATALVSEVLEMSSHICPPVFKPLPLGAPLFFAVQILAEGVHAVPIVDTSGRIVRMLTQADVVRFVAQHLDELQPMGSMTVGDLRLGAGSEARLVTARFSDKAFDIFQALRERQAPAAPVVDNYGAMTANLSFSDVKAIAKRANFSALQLPISQFFTAIEKGTEVMSPSIYVKASTQLQSLVLTLAATKIHQLYFVDDALHPVGCVRVGDVLKALIREDDA